MRKGSKQGEGRALGLSLKLHDRDQTMTYKQIGEELGMTRQGVEALTKVAMAKLVRRAKLFELVKEAGMWKELNWLRRSKWKWLEGWPGDGRSNDVGGKGKV